MMSEIEAETLGAMLSRPALVGVALERGACAAWFSQDGWSLMWSALEGFWRRGAIEDLSPTVALEEAKRLAAQEKESRSAEQLSVGTVCDAIDKAPVTIDTHLTLLCNDYIERAAKKVVADTFKDFKLYANAADVVTNARERLDGVLDASIAAKKIPPRVILDGLMGEYREAHRMRVATDGPRDLKWTPGLKMPWPKITLFMNGLRPGLHVVAARPSVGKTSYAVNLMRFWCEHGIGVLFCSLDMPRGEVMRRFLAECARVSSRKASFSPTQTDLAAMDAAVERVAAWPLEIVETRDVDDLRMVATISKLAGRCRVVVVDYLQLLHARALHREDAVEYARVSYASDSLKRLANDLNVPVIALAQLNRESTKPDANGRMPGLAELRGSGSIEQDAFTVTILHRDADVAKRWASGEDEQAKRLIPGTVDNPQYKYNLGDLDPVWWIMCKAQNGPTGKFPFVVRKKYFAWMLSDYDATPNTSTIGYGSTAREYVDNSPYFHRVHSDWRHDALEATLRVQLALIDDPEEVVDDESDSDASIADAKPKESNLF
jgi:replicative DNA helicase